MEKTLSREGHRQRIRNSYIKNGLDGMHPHNILELILTYSIPRKDVKGAAYSLLNHFENDMNALFGADIDELCQIDGIGESSAVLIRLFDDILNIFEDGQNKAELISDYISVKEYVRDCFEGENQEQLVLICTDTSGRVIAKEQLSAADNAREIVEAMMKNGAPCAVIVHAVGNSDYLPRDTDINTAQAVFKALKPLGLKLEDYVISGRNGTLSMYNDVRYMDCFNG